MVGWFWNVEIIFLLVNEISSQVWEWILSCSLYDAELVYLTTASTLFQEKHPTSSPTLANKMMVSWRFGAFFS